MGNYQVNPMQLVQMIKGGANPQQLLMSVLEGSMSNTPIGQNLLTLAKGNQTQGIEQIARNICQQKGVDYDTAFNTFKNNLGIK